MARERGKDLRTSFGFFSFRRLHNCSPPCSQLPIRSIPSNPGRDAISSALLLASARFLEPVPLMKLTIVSRSGRDLVAGGLTVPDGATVDDLKAAFHAAKPKFYPSRQRFTLPVPHGAPPKTRGVALENGKSLSKDLGLNAGDTVVFKDLGTQVPYAVVFLAEYAGPMLAYLPFYACRSEIYGDLLHMKGATKPMLTVQTIATVVHTAHYLKRILETVFVHHFSHATMPVVNLFRNCSYYWGFAAFMSYFINHPQYTPVGHNQMLIGFAVSTLAQLGNLHCHVYQASLRADGSKAYKEPKRGLFAYVTCANYACEIYQWVGFNVATQSACGWFFVLCGGFQMFDWANAKHARLRKLFPGFKRQWKLLPPFY